MVTAHREHLPQGRSRAKKDVKIKGQGMHFRVKLGNKRNTEIDYFCEAVERHRRAKWTSEETLEVRRGFRSKDRAGQRTGNKAFNPKEWRGQSHERAFPQGREQSFVDKEVSLSLPVSTCKCLSIF